MAAGTVSLRHFILGLLTQQPMSGYDIKRFLQGLSWLVGSPSGGSLYPVLRSLRAEDLVTVEVVPGVDRPPKKIYTITQAGRKELRTWIEQPAAAKAPLRAFVMRLLLASLFSPASLTSHLQHRRAQVAAHQQALCQAAGSPEDREHYGRFLAMDYGLAMASAELAWLDRALDELAERPRLQEVA
jgi:DNA-binding PadR family transcriptional regulator